MNIYVSGTGLTKFGELFEKSLLDLALEASVLALKESRIAREEIDAVVVSNMLAEKISGQSHLGALVSSALGLKNVEAFRVEAACASGGVAVKKGVDLLRTGNYRRVLILGVEKMTDQKAFLVTEALATAAGAEKESFYGFTFPSLYALMANRYFHQYKIGRKELAMVAVKNHYHGARNSKAHFQKEINLETVLKSSMIAEPLSLFDSSPISDGAAAVILSTEKPRAANPVRIIASSCASDSLALADRASLTSIASAKVAAKKAFKEAGLEPKDIDVLEVHDCFTIAEIIALEDLGFFKKGEAGKAVRLGKTYCNQALPVNTSGGLKAAGHPVGATGVKQIIEIAYQLQNRATDRQVKNPKFGLTHNVGGSGATAVVNILTNS